MKNIEMFGKRIPVWVLIATIVLSAAGAGIMAFEFAKGPQTFYATGKASVIQQPNRIVINENITVSPVNSTPASENFDNVFTLFHRNNKLVLVDVKLTNTNMLNKFFDDFVVLIRRQDSDDLLATLTLNEPADAFVDNDSNALSGIRYRASIFYTARNDTPVGRIPVIITAQVTSQ